VFRDDEEEKAKWRRRIENASLSDSVCPSYSFLYFPFFLHSSVSLLFYSFLPRAFSSLYTIVLHHYVYTKKGGGRPTRRSSFVDHKRVDRPVKGAYSPSCEAKVEAASGRNKKMSKNSLRCANTHTFHYSWCARNSHSWKGTAVSHRKWTLLAATYPRFLPGVIFVQFLTVLLRSRKKWKIYTTS
jgi:hypothetical protein